MLSLNSLSNLPAEPRIAPDAKAKVRPSDDQKGQSDFASYMVAMAQPVKIDPPAQAPMRAPDTAPVDRPAPAHENSSYQSSTETQTLSAQKAGHEPAAERPDAEKVTTEAAKTEKETGEVKSAKAQPLRSDKELLEALGLVSKKTSPGALESLQKMLRPTIDTQTSTAQQKGELTKTAKGQTAVVTLQQLQKAPDLILANADGLKRLGEKLGLAFLGKVSEKLTEKQTKSENSQTNTKAEGKTETIAHTTAVKSQKTGDSSAEQNAQYQNSSKSAKTTPVKNVSRETLAAETTEKPTPMGGDLKPVVVQPETAITRLNNAAQGEHRLAESVSTIRGAENIRSAVENPLMRADLVRQFNEVMGRAQVLVADSQNAQFSVKLYPRDIGRMEIDLKLVEGEIRGKIVVESEDVKNEMQNYLKQRDNSPSEHAIDMNKIDIEVRNGNQQAQNPEGTSDADTLLQNLVTRAAAATYEMTESNSTAGSVLYA